MAWRREERKRTRDDFDYNEGPSFSKRGRRSDPTGYRRGGGGGGWREGGGGRREMSTEDRLVSLIERVGSDTTSLESNLESLAELICQELTEYRDKILQTITRCARDLSEKTTIYSALVGILNARKFELGEELLDMVLEELKSALALNKFQVVKTLIRFLADLTNTKVISQSSIISLFDTLITVTYEPGISQLRSDWYTFVLLSSLPWVGAELQSKRQLDLDRIMTALRGYMSKRVTNYLPALQVWQTENPYPQKDQLELLWLQVLKMKEEGWKEAVLVRPYGAFESELSSSYTHPLPNVIIPGHTLDSAYPFPRAIFRCIGESDIPAHIGPNFPSLESINRFLIQDTINSIINSYSQNRKNCAQHLNSLIERLQHLPIEYMVAEFIFGLIFRLPSPSHCLLYYSSLNIELCKLRPATYPTILSQLTDILFSQVDHMNFVISERFSWWFSYHLSNYNYHWDWNKWIGCVHSSPDNPSYLFVKQVFERCVRLASYEVFSELIPDEFQVLLPHTNQSYFLYSEGSDDEVPGTDVAKKLVQSIRSKVPIDTLREVLESTGETRPDFNEEQLLELKVSILTHCVLHVGDKTISHCFIALHKFRSLFLELLESESAKLYCLSSVAEFFEQNLQLHVLVVDRLVRQELINNLVVIKWLFKTASHTDFTSRLSWDILRGCFGRARQSLQQCEKEMEEGKEKLKKTTGLDEVIGDGEEKQELKWQVQEFEEKVEEKKSEQREVYVSICQYLVEVLSTHLTRCDQESLDYETPWFVCVSDHMRQLLVQNHIVYQQYVPLLEGTCFNSETDARIQEIYQQFIALLG